jgi:hypothetical protein
MDIEIDQKQVFTLSWLIPWKSSVSIFTVDFILSDSCISLQITLPLGKCDESRYYANLTCG